MEHFSDEYIELLARKYKEGTLSAKEQKDFLKWYGQLAEDTETVSETQMQLGDRIFKNIEAELGNQDYRPEQKSGKSYVWIGAAASLLLIFGLGYLFYSFSNKPLVQQESLHLQSPEAEAGTSKAFLTLPNGQKIDLTKTAPDVLAKLTGMPVGKSSGEALVYNMRNEAGATPSNKMNVLSVPAGGEYEIVLHDGTHVWMNAASSLSYPEHFGSNERIVSLQGEAYFEVAHDAARPFKVITKRQVVQVLGTHFNVKAYDDDAQTVTTLVQGAVRVSSAGKQGLIRPGQQASSDEKNDLEIANVSLKSALAWKNGMIEFQDSSLPQLMRQIARWYDIKVEYEGPQRKDLFTGGISRHSRLSALLNILKANDIRFSMRVEGTQKILIVH